MPEDITLGEIGRSVTRIEAGMNNLATQVQAAITLAAGHSIQIAQTVSDVKELSTKVETQNTRTAYISGGIASLVAALNLLFNFFAGRTH